MSFTTSHSNTVWTATLDTSAREAAHEMERRHVGFLVVVEAGRVEGVVTDRDLALRILAGKLDPETTPVREVMTKPVVCLAANDPLSSAAALMSKHGVRRLPIVDDDGAPVGVITADDVVRKLGQRMDKLSEAVTRELSLEATPIDTQPSIYGRE
jgi:CBS domain-containing protein